MQAKCPAAVGLPDTEGVPPGAPVPAFVTPSSPASTGSAAQGLPLTAPAPAAAPAEAPTLSVPTFTTSCIVNLAGNSSTYCLKAQSCMSIGNQIQQEHLRPCQADFACMSNVTLSCSSAT